MKRTIKNIRVFLFGILFLLLVQACGIYSFSGISISPDTKTFQVNLFQNQAALIEAGLDRDFTRALQDLIINQTNLSIVNAGGDIVYEGEITEYYIAPNTATSDNKAAENRLTISVNLRFYDTKDETQDLEQRFTFFYDYPGSTQLLGSDKDTAHEEIFNRLTRDIFNATLAKW